MSRTAEQIALMESVKESIRSRPENWNQKWWARATEYSRPIEARDEVCGTQLCTAGWAVVNAGVAKIKSYPSPYAAVGRSVDLVYVEDETTKVNAENVAQDLLGLTFAQSSEIFYATDVSDPEVMIKLIDRILEWEDGEQPINWELEYREIVPDQHRYYFDDEDNR